MILNDIEKFAAGFTAMDARNYVTSEEALLPELAGLRIFNAPIFGVASATDPIFKTFQQPEVVGEFFRLPESWLPGAVSVISYFLPFTREVRVSNHIPGRPSAGWLHGRIEGQKFLEKLSHTICDFIRSAGYQCVSPALEPEFKVFSDRETNLLASNWSERHIAYAAGLGAFGLSRSFITRLGTAGRYGSFVTTLPLQPSARDHAYMSEFCEKCGACVSRCPSGAISIKRGKDKSICNARMDETKVEFKPRYGCGKCQTNVPCESAFPSI